MDKNKIVMTIFLYDDVELAEAQLIAEDLAHQAMNQDAGGTARVTHTVCINPKLPTSGRQANGLD